MERHVFGSTNREIPVIGQGTWRIDSRDRSSAIATLRRGIDLGMTHIDTAEIAIPVRAPRGVLRVTPHPGQLRAASMIW